MKPKTYELFGHFQGEPYWFITTSPDAAQRFIGMTAASGVFTPCLDISAAEQMQTLFGYYTFDQPTENLVQKQQAWVKQQLESDHQRP